MDNNTLHRSTVKIKTTIKKEEMTRTLNNRELKFDNPVTFNMKKFIIFNAIMIKSRWLNRLLLQKS